MLRKGLYMSQGTRYTIHPQALGEYHLDKHRLGEGPPVGQEPHQAQQPQAKVSSWFALITVRLPDLARPAGLWSLNPLAGVLGGYLVKLDGVGPVDNRPSSD